MPKLDPTGGIKPSGTYQPPTPGLSPGNTLTGIQPGEKQPPTPTRRQMGNTGINGGGMPTLSGSLGGPPSSMGGLSSPKQHTGMPQPRPTRNFGSRLRANRGLV